MNFSLFILLLFCIIFKRYASLELHNENLTFYEQNWIQIFNSFDTSFQNTTEYYVQQIKDIETEKKINPLCANHLIRMFEKVSSELWAAKMMDSSGHLPSGILSGTITSFGDFDQCIAINELIEENMRIEGKYCFLTIRPKRSKKFNAIKLNTTKISSNWFEREVNDWLEIDNFVPFANGICFPNVCEQNEIKIVLGTALNILSNFEFDVNYCQTRQKPNYRSGIYIALSIVLAMIVLIILGTLSDNYLKNSRLLAIRLLKCFSVINNIKILFKISTLKTNTEYRLQFFHGLRVLGTLWVISAHSGGFILVSAVMKISPFAHFPEDGIEVSKYLFSQYIINASLAVQIFFMMSGILTVYTVLSKKKLEISFIQYILLRWLRFTPPLVGLLCFTILLEILGSGPLFQTNLLKPFVDPCYDHWWAHMAYIINWFDLRQMCGVQTWYLGADFQLHIISFFVIYFFYKKQPISHLFTYAMIVVGALIPVVLVASKVSGLPRVDVLFKPKYPTPVTAVKLYFFGTHIHLISYFFGCIIGFALINKTNAFISLSKRWRAVIWCTTTLLIVTIPALSYPIMQTDSSPVDNYAVVDAFMFSLVLILWSLSLSWFIYNCALNRAGTLPKLLSANFMQPLSRLSFCAYLTHVMLIWFNVQQVRYPISTNPLSLTQYYCTILVETFALALLLYLTFEAPFVNIIKLIFIGEVERIKPAAQEEDIDNSVISMDTNNNYNIKIKNNRNSFKIEE